MSHITVEGYANFDPDSRYLDDGTMLTMFQVSESYTNRAGVKVYTNYYVQVSGDDAGAKMRAQVKAKRVYRVSGLLTLSPYINKSGEPMAGATIYPNAIEVVKGATKEVEYSTT